MICFWKLSVEKPMVGFDSVYPYRNVSHTYICIFSTYLECHPFLWECLSIIFRGRYFMAVKVCSRSSWVSLLWWTSWSTTSKTSCSTPWTIFCVFQHSSVSIGPRTNPILSLRSWTRYSKSRNEGVDAIQVWIDSWNREYQRGTEICHSTPSW